MMKMNLGWNEKTKLEKYIFVLECICAVILSVCFVLMQMEKLQDNLFYLFLGIETALEAVAQWKRNRKMAILSLAAAGIVLGICAVTYFL